MNARLKAECPNPEPKREHIWAPAPLVKGAEPQNLGAHLSGTALFAEAFLPPGTDAAFGAHMGLRHDVGKASTSWQRFIRAAGSGHDLGSFNSWGWVDVRRKNETG